MVVVPRGFALVSAIFLLTVLGAAGAGGCKRAGALRLGPGDGGVDADGSGADLLPDLLPDWSPADVGPGEPVEPRPELCDNHLDDDGNGLVDEGCVCVPGTVGACYPGPTRLAGVGSCAMGLQRCVGTSEFGSWGACEGAKTPSGEACDGLDNDCDGQVDDGCPCRPGEMRACYGGPTGTSAVGTCREGTRTCLAGADGVGSFWGACNGDVRPDREVCDELDNDCNGTVDDGCECRPGESRRCYGGAAGTEGKGLCAAGTQPCLTKTNGSEWGPCEGQTLPKPELCDLIDNDCDGTIDDGCACTPGATDVCYDGPAGTRGVGPCADGARTCLAGPGGVGSDWGPCTGTRLPGAETCNEIDDDCDGTVDDGCACRRGEMRACYEGPPSTADVGVCRSGSQACVIEEGVARFGPCAGQALPAPGGELCNGMDDDCDGRVDGIGRACGSDVGDCRRGTETCTAGTWGACAGAVGPAPEDCNGGDENCDGMVDEGCECFDGATRSCGPPEAGTGRCKAGTQLCETGRWGGCVGSVGPVSETCNLVDDDCDGTIDDGCVCLLGEMRDCYDGPPGTAGVAACRAGTQTCVAQAGVATWSSCANEVLPVPETCNALDDDCNGLPDDGLTTPAQVIVPRGQNREVDLLFVIDDSRSMDASQASLIANFPVLMNTLRGFPGGLPNLHLAVVTSDLGAGPETGIGNCTPGGKGGIFRAPTPTPTCRGPTGTFIVESDNEATKNYPGTIDEAFSCIANVGAMGCGLEHQIASAARALGWGGTVPTSNQGFLRPDAFLAVTFITNEDDCSAPPDTQLFTLTSQRIADPWGPLDSFRCNDFGHACGGAALPRAGTTPVTLADCRPADGGPLYPISPFVDFFRSLKTDPTMLFISGIMGPVAPYTINYIPNPSFSSELKPVIGHSCTRTDGSYADPPLRMADFVSRFGPNGSVSSICNDSYAPALTQLGAAIGRAFSSHCLDTAVPDADAAKAGIQAACQVVLRAPGSPDRALPACDAATPEGGPQPCWYLTSNASCGSGVLFALNRIGATAAGETISIRCPTCR